MLRRVPVFALFLGSSSHIRESTEPSEKILGECFLNISLLVFSFLLLMLLWDEQG